MYTKDEEGNFIAEKHEVLERWKQYFQKLLNAQTEEDKEEDEDEKLEVIIDANNEGSETCTEAPTEEEIETIINKFKNNKSPGQNGVTAENIKNGGKALKEQIVKLIEEVWTTEKMSESWNKAVIVPIHKKGDIAECKNYRGIALLGVVYKILATLIKQRLEDQADKLIGEYQGGFRKDRSTTDQIFTLKQVLTSCYEYEIPTYINSK